MLHIRRLLVCAAALSPSCLGLAQQAQQPPPDNSRAASGAAAVKKVSATEASKEAPKGTVKPREEQKLAFQTLESSEGASRGFEAPMRSYGLLQIGSTFATLDAQKARGLLREAFTASLEIHDDDDTKSRLQQEIFRTLLPLSQDDVEELLPQAEISVRTPITEVIVGRYAEKKQFDKAIDLVNQLTSVDEFPYGCGRRLMDVMPPEMIAEKQALFTQAVSSYQNHEHKAITIGDSFTNLVVRVGSAMPPKLALQAIDNILSQAKANDEQQASITVGGAGGSVSFNSLYQYQLFALLPLLHQLDEGRAQKLLDENQALQTRVQQFPQGVQSLDPNPPGSPGKHGLSTSVRTGKAGGGSPGGGGEDYMQQVAERRMEDIVQEGATDPTQAIAHAMTLPVKIAEGPGRVSPRAGALEGIARASVKKNPGGASQALAELRKVIADLPPRAQVRYLSSAADLYLQMEEKDNADAVVGEGFKVADKLLEKDADPNAPNAALKAWWPSTDAYRRFVEVETKISRRATMNMLKEIKDPEIRALESIMYARALLGLPLKHIVVVEKSKDGHSMSVDSD